MQGVIAIDWGTSAFRLWVMGPQGVLASSRGTEGMKHCLDAGFAPVLAHHLARAHAPPDWPILICGMAGARGAWTEVPYIPLPAPVTAVQETGRKFIRGLPINPATKVFCGL